MSIKENDRVRIIRAEGELAPLIGAIGEVERIHDLSTGRIAIVKIIPDENVAREIVVKFRVENLEKVEPKAEIPEGAKQITKADFEAAIEEITSPEKALSGGSNPMATLTEIMTAKIVGDGVKDKIFKDQDAIVMTADDFVVALWDACNPSTVDETAGNKLGVRKTVKIAITAIICLEEIVDILFGDEA